jgi:hypothetical protein
VVIIWFVILMRVSKWKMLENRELRRIIFGFKKQE